MRPRGGRGWLAAGALLAALVVDRLLIARTSGHLLFHIDGAEYFYLMALAPFEGQSIGSVLTDPHLREVFLRSTLGVADLALHGSTVPPGIVLHALLEHGGMPWSTGTLKLAALGYATLTVALWILLLGGAWRSSGAAWRFAALALLGPTVFVKLNLLHWGTHEQVMLWHAVLMVLVGRWMTAGEAGRPGRRRGRPVARQVGLGVLGVPLLLLNFSLAVPVLFTMAWIAGSSGWLRGRDRGVTTAAAMGGGLFAVGVGSLALGWWAITRVELVGELGFQGALWRNDKLDEALSLAAFHGPWDAVTSLGAGAWSLLPGVAVAAVVLGSWVVRRDTNPPPSPLRFLSSYLLFSILVLSVVPVAYDQHGVWRPRFLAHLWPVSFAVIALWCAAHKGWPGHAALAAVLLLGLPVQWARIDLANLSAGARYDGARLFELQYQEEGALPADRLRLAGVSRDHLIGFGVLRQYQTMEYWEWTPPRKAARLDHVAILEAYPGAPGLPPPPLGPGAPEPGASGYLEHALEAAGIERPEFYRGIGAAYRVLLPPARGERFDEIVAAIPDAEGWLREGYGASATR